MSMLRLGTALPLRLLRDGASKQFTPAPAAITSTICQRQFSTTESLDMKRRGALIHVIPRPRKKKRYPDPQRKRVAEARQRKNVARQTVLQEERAIASGDPVRGAQEPTAFIKSLDTGMTAEEAAGETNAADASKATHLTSFIQPEELEAMLARSETWAKHPKETRAGAVDPTKEARIEALQKAEHETAKEAMQRILAVQAANQKQKKHINIQRCIDEFGRHNASKSAATTTDAQQGPKTLIEKTRIGPDTGSSEVQIAILTAKIRRLADEQETRGGQDKVNKRNLRLLVHRRQKLLQYFLRKSRGGPSWQNLIESLGLTPATWKGEIVL